MCLCYCTIVMLVKLVQLLQMPQLAPSSTTSALSPSSPSTTSSDVSSAVLGSQRHNGFERPFSRDQVISWIGHSLSALCFYVGAAGIIFYLNTDQGGGDEKDRNTVVITWTLVAMVVHALNSIVLVMAWTSCEMMDPAIVTDRKGWWGVRLDGPRWEKTRYCALCRKAVPGLDHHCTWLQTCVGKSNYAQFFTVACTGTVQFVLQVVYTALCVLWLLHHPLHDVDTFGYFSESCLIVCLVISVPCMFMYFVLVGFHLWLMVLGYGTYEWMLRRRKEERAKHDAKKRQLKPASDEAVESSSSCRDSESTEHTSHTTIQMSDINVEERERELTVL